MQPADGVISHRNARVLFRQRRGRRELCVRENDRLRWLHFDRHDVQAALDPNDPARLVAPYANAMIAALLFKPAPDRLLNLGIGGGGFERFFARYFPAVQISSVERDPQVIALARRFFQLPADHPVVLDRAEAFLQRHQQQYPLILCDIHEGSRHPQAMLTPAFLGDLARCLSGDGVCVLNLLPDRYEDLLAAVLAVREHFPWVWLLDVPQRRNRVLFGLRSAPADEQVRRDRAQQLYLDCGVNLPALLPLLTEIARPTRPAVQRTPAKESSPP